MIGFLGADCILLALARAAIAIGRDQFNKGTLSGTPVVCVPIEGKKRLALRVVHNIPIRQ